jgi:hypothetical protein
MRVLSKLTTKPTTTAVAVGIQTMLDEELRDIPE